MAATDKGRAVIIGAGPGLSGSLARLLAREGYAVTLAARNTDKIADLADDIGAERAIIDGSDPDAVAKLFAGFNRPPRIAVYNPSARVRGPVAELNPEEVRRAIEITAFGSFVMGREAAAAMLQAEPVNGCRGTILFTGASAGVKGFAQSASFAMGKFAQRGLAQSMARELHPKGIHVAWVNIDGAIASERRPDDGGNRMLDPNAIAHAYLNLINQHPSTWSNELTIRPWVEAF